jgi:hypothetical protein
MGLRMRRWFAELRGKKLFNRCCCRRRLRCCCWRGGREAVGIGPTLASMAGK